MTTPERTQPAVSILMSVKDGEPYLQEALDSLLAQTRTDFELVVVDDGSHDRTWNTLTRRAADDGRLVLLKNDRTLGIPRSLNRALERCRGPLVAKADADDVYDPRRLEIQLAYLAEHPEVGVLGSSYRRIRADGELIDVERPPQEHHVIAARQHFMNSFLHSSTVFRLEDLRAVGGYDAVYWTAQDSDLLERLRHRVRFANVDEVLVSYRVHDRSMMRTRGEAGAALSATVPERLLSHLLGRPLSPHLVASVVSLYQGFEPLPPAAVSCALPVLLEAVHRIGSVHAPDAAAFVRKEAATNLFTQARWLRHVDGLLAARLVMAPLRLDPSNRQVWSWPGRRLKRASSRLS